MSKKKEEKVLPYKILFTFLVILVYMICRKIPLYGIDTQAYRDLSLNAGDFITQAIGGDAYQYSLLALGISPYIFSGIIMQFYSAYKKSVLKARVSAKKVNRITVFMTLVIAIVQAFFAVQNLIFLESDYPLWMLQGIAGMEMVTGVTLIVWWTGRNKKFGIGGQTAIILVNILDRIRGTFLGNTWEDLMLPLIVSFFVMLMMLVMENAEMRIPLQRVSIHNIYSDKNYLAIKLNPVGVMPVMFAGAFFLIPQLLVKGLVYLFPENLTMQWWMEHMTLSYSFGIGVYIANLYLMTVLFALIIISPGEMAEQFLQSGDSIVNLHAGKDTRRYLRRTVIILSLFSATVMGVCIGIPLFLQLGGQLQNELVMFPTSIMMLTGLWCNFFREIQAVKCYDRYDTFL